MASRPNGEDIAVQLDVPNPAELLRAVGVKTVNELKFRNPEHLVVKMREANKRNLVRLLPKKQTVERWIESAKKLPTIIRY